MYAAEYKTSTLHGVRMWITKLKITFVDPSKDRRINCGRLQNPAVLLDRPEALTLPLVTFEVNFEVHTLRKLHFRERPEPSERFTRTTKELTGWTIKRTLRCKRILQKLL